MSAVTAPVLVALPVTNSAQTLMYALDSLRTQTWTDFAAVILDLHPSEETEDIVRMTVGNDRRFRYKPWTSRVSALRSIITESRSPFFKWMGADEVLMPTFLGACLGMLGCDRSAVLAHPQTLVVDDSIKLPASRWDELEYQADPLQLAEDVRPEHRFEDVLLRMTWCTAAYGVIRMEALRNIRLAPPLPDTLQMLAELALEGPFRQNSDFLNLRRRSGVEAFNRQASTANRTRNLLGMLSASPLHATQLAACRQTVMDLSVNAPPLAGGRSVAIP